MSVEQDLELLEAVRNWRPPKQLHPSAMVAVDFYEKNGKSLPPAAIQELRDALNSYGDDLIGLAEALEGIARFVLLMQHLGDDATGQKVADLMREYTHRFEPFWERVGEALQNVGDEARGVFFQFVDANRQDKKTAPKYGEPPPAGSVPLKNLVQPARPPPWAKKKGK